MEITNKIEICSHSGFQPLEICMVGRSYPPEFYSKITNPNVRSVMERIATETEEDYQKLIDLLQSLGVQTVRPEIQTDNNFEEYMLIRPDGSRWYQPPPMNPRDWLLVIGNKLIYDRPCGEQYVDFFDPVIDNIIGEKYHVRDYPIFKNINGPSVTRIGLDLYFDAKEQIPQKLFDTHFLDYRCHPVYTGGHSDAVFCPVTPGLIVSLRDYQGYQETFPGWEVVYLPGQHWDMVEPWRKLKEKNRGRWWVPGEEMNDEVTDFVNTWLSDWVGYVEETVFDINMLVVDEKTVICNNYNEKTFRAFERFGVTAHTCNFRHRYFWDGGLHCITLDLKRSGPRQDYFPQRAKK
jgi:hypothetical protein